MNRGDVVPVKTYHPPIERGVEELNVERVGHGGEPDKRRGREPDPAIATRHITPSKYHPQPIPDSRASAVVMRR